MYLLVWSRSDSSLQLRKTLFQFSHLQGQNKETHGWQWHFTRHTQMPKHTPIYLLFHWPFILFLPFELKICLADHKYLQVHSAATLFHAFPLYLGRLIEFLLLWSAVQLVQYHSIWAFSRRQLAVSCGAATAALCCFQLGKQTPVGRRKKPQKQTHVQYCHQPQVLSQRVSPVARSMWSFLKLICFSNFFLRTSSLDIFSSISHIVFSHFTIASFMLFFCPLNRSTLLVIH